MAAINLVRKTVSIPDDGLKLHVVYEDQGNPLKDSDGNIQYTDKLDDAGQRIPEYPEFCADVDLPTLSEGTTPTVDTVSSLLTCALDIAKTQAINSVTNTELRDAYKPIVESVAPTTATGYQETTGG